MRDEAGGQVASGTTKCPFLGIEDGKCNRLCVAKRGDPIQIGSPYLDACCLTRLHETCDLFLRAVVRGETAVPGTEPEVPEHRGIVRRIWKFYTSHEPKPASTMPVPPQVRQESPLTEPDHVASDSLYARVQAEAEALEVENAHTTDMAQPTAQEIRPERVVLREEPKCNETSLEPAVQPDRRTATTSIDMSEVEPPPVFPQPKVEPAVPALAHEAAATESASVFPDPSTAGLDSIITEAQPAVLNLSPGQIAPQKERESMPLTVPVPVITGPIDRATVHAYDLVISGTAGSNLTVQLLDWGVLVADTVAKSDGTWSILLPHTDEGEHLYSAKALDGAGRTSGQSELLPVITVHPSPSEPVRFWRAPYPRRERFQDANVSPPPSNPPIRRLSIAWGPPTTGAAMIVLAGLGFFVFVQPHSELSSEPYAPAVIGASALEHMWSFTPVPAGTQYEVLTFANPGATPKGAEIRARGAFVRSLVVPPRSGAEVVLNSTLFDHIITVTAPEPITTGSIVTVQGSVRFSRGRTVSFRSQTSKP